MGYRIKNVLIYLIYLLCNWDTVLSIKFYEGKQSTQYDCNVKFVPEKEYTCACLSGVWKIFKSECEEINTVGGVDYCFELPPGDKVRRAEKILDSASDISIRYQNGSLLAVKEENILTLDGSEIITTGVDWSVAETGEGNVFACLSPTEDNYCQFSLPAPVKRGKFTIGCPPGSSKVAPKNCEYFQKTNNNICENSMQAGRVFLIAPGMNTTIISDPANQLNDTDEDFYIKENITESRDEIATEIWNFIDKGLDKILKIESLTTKAEKNYSSVPVFHILQLAREVMKKTCPEFYVKPQFFDMAVFTFIQMQKKAFKQEDFPTEYFGYMRIVEALKACTKNSTAYPFINNFTCTENGEPLGIYTNDLNETDEVNIALSSLPLTREPIIETVWKIFYNAHSHCFQYFDESFNDHHRFTTWMTPLFQNNINDVWLNGSSEKIVFGNMFGNMVDIQTRVSYCTTYSRFESDYPWDLPIPPKMVPYLSGSNTTSASTGAGRRKRGVTDPKTGQCIPPIQLPKC